MSVYSDKTFRAVDYNKFRPTYPQSIFDKVISYHGKKINLLIDLGCGPGEGTLPFAKFDQVEQVIGTDASQVMVDLASNLNTYEKVSFEKATGEDLSVIGIEDNSVDVITAAECSHWFNHEIWFREMSRVLKDGGTLAYWSYIDAGIMEDPVANEINEQFIYLDPRYCGPLWQQPGKEHLRIGMRGVDYFLSKNKNFEQIETKLYDPTSDDAATELYIERQMTIGDFMNLLDTWSAVHSWRKIHKDETDILDLWFQEFEKRLNWSKDTPVKIVWETHYTLAKRKARN